MAKDGYVQCKLNKNNSWITSWIPERLAKVDLVVNLKEDDGRWIRGWTVKKVGHRVATRDELIAYHNAWRTYRSLTDDSKKNRETIYGQNTRFEKG